MTRIMISGTGIYTPPYAISNEELVASFNAYVDSQKNVIPNLTYSDADFIFKASGIKSRYVMEKSGILDIQWMRPRLPKRDTTEKSLQCEISVEAAKVALKNANISVDSLDMVMVACSNMERPYPAVAIEVQEALGISGFAFDLNVACSSATFAIQTAMNALIAGSAKGVLIVNPEVCSAHLNFRDRDSHFIFGDACTAIILQREDAVKGGHAFEIISTELKTNFSNNIRNNFGFLNQCDAEPRAYTDLLFVQQGRKVFKEVIPLVSDTLLLHLQREGIDVKEIKRFWLHQANLNMNQLIVKKILDRDATLTEAPSVIHEYANTSSAGSIIVFHQYHEDLQSGDIGLLSSFGAGYSVGSVILKKK